MSQLSEDKLLSFLADIQPDIRQIKSDLQAPLYCEAMVRSRHFVTFVQAASVNPSQQGELRDK